MSQRCLIRALASVDVVPKAFAITGTGTARVKVGTGLWDRAPINDVWAQGVRPSTQNVSWQNTVDVYVGDPAAPTPQLDLSGVWSLVLDENGDPVVQPSPFDAATDVNILQKVEFVRNEYT